MSGYIYISGKIHGILVIHQVVKILTKVRYACKHVKYYISTHFKINNVEVMRDDVIRIYHNDFTHWNHDRGSFM